MCFAYKGSLPNFRVITSFTDVVIRMVEGNSVPQKFADFQSDINLRIKSVNMQPSLRVYCIQSRII